MKRMTAWFMALCLATTCLLPVRAEEAKPKDTGGGFHWASQEDQTAGKGNGSTQTDTGGSDSRKEGNDAPSGESGKKDTDTATGESGKTDKDTEAANSNKTEQDKEAGDDAKTDKDTQAGNDDKTDKEAGDNDETDQDTGDDGGEKTDQNTGSDQNKQPDSDSGKNDQTDTSTTPDADVSRDDDTSGDEAPVEPVTDNEGDTDAVTYDLATDWNDSTPGNKESGGIEVIVGNGLLLAEKTELTVSVEGGKSSSKKVILEPAAEGGTEPDRETVLFESLPAGTYTLRITAKGFGDFVQQISVDNEIRTAVVYTGFVELEGCAYEKDAVHPGVMLRGDASGDGRIDDADRDALIDAISSGKMNLVDLQCYANSREEIREKTDTASSLTGRLSEDAVKVNINDDKTLAKGDPDALFGEGGSLELRTRQGGAVSENNPVEFGFNLLHDAAKQGQEVEQLVISAGEAGIPEQGTVLVELDGKDPLEMEIRDGRLAGNTRMLAARDSGMEEDGRLVIDLGGQVAVKKVSIRITKAGGSGDLVQITRVEFLNDMENRIPEPEMFRPENLQVENANKSFTLTWDRAVNVTGYEVKLTCGDQTEYVRTAENRLEVKNFKGNKLKNGEVYEASVQSVNGAWRSGYGASVRAIPKVDSRPDAPDNLRVTGGFRCLRLGWKDMEDTDTYNVFYKEAGTSTFRKIADLTANTYEIKGLKDQTRYEVYVTGVNDMGESNPSIHSEAQTIAVNPAQMPLYNLLNESRGKGKVSAHIVSVTHVRGNMESSPLDQDNRSALGTVDKDYSSYYQIMDWDDGGSYVSPDKGLTFTLDDYYKMNYITFAETEDLAAFSGASVFYYDKEHPDGTYVKGEDISVVQRRDGNGRRYYAIKLAHPITTNKIRLGFTRYGNLRNIVISEVNFYRYDSLEDDIMALYADDLHTSLREDVEQATIDTLQKRLDTKDEKSGEYHPEKAALQKELDNARGLLGKEYSDIVTVHTGMIAGRDSHLGFSGLNGWQPLGVTAYEGEQVVIYVGHDKLRTGAPAALQLVATQYHAEAGAFASVVSGLRVGRNEITIPSIQSLACEGGGALYIQYTGNNENETYAVRVSGGVREPVLDLYGVTDPQERSARISAYVKELDSHTQNQKTLHREIHEGAREDNKVNRPYEEQNCILGATDIVLDQMMLSVSGQQILAGLGSGSVSERAGRLDASLRAMEEMMELFYHHKGLSFDPSAPETDRMPSRHLNIRYMRMFAGAFMYASGNHIGIEWGSVPGLASSSPVVSEDNGKYISGRYFGWGIAHEIGHNINQGCYALAEVTNNYFALLAAAKDSNDSVRFKYPDVYKKVTSNTVGRASNVFTQLAMYWQLHLAYDRDYNYKMYDSYEMQHNNLFYARVDSYARNASLAPGGLKLDGDRDQNFMRLSCAAAEKDLTEFFLRWGLLPDTETFRYAGQFAKEERALYYLTDDARVYEIQHGTSGNIQGKDVIELEQQLYTEEATPNEVKMSFTCEADPNVILGYEIARYQYEDGKPVRQVVGFTTETTYSDFVSTINNRVLTYEVTAVDKFGYRSNPEKIGNVKISHDGSHDKSMWSIVTNMTSDSDKKETATEELPCEPETLPGIYKVIDNNYKGDLYQGSTSGEDAFLEVRMNQVLPVCGLKLTSSSKAVPGRYRIQISMDGNSWTTVKEGSFNSASGSQTVYFENDSHDPWVCTYDAAYVRLTAVGQTGMSMTEIDLLGPSGDNISFGVGEDAEKGAVGILLEDYVYEQKDGQEKKIPADSLVFMGRYKGNPAYNVVMLYDAEGAVIGGVDEEGVLKAEQIILAKVPENGLLGEVSDGIWIYWIEPDEEGNVPSFTGKVRASLYRVDNALTNEGQRIVSDTLPLQVPAKPDGITLEKEAGTGQQ